MGTVSVTSDGGTVLTPQRMQSMFQNNYPSEHIRCAGSQRCYHVLVPLDNLNAGGMGADETRRFGRFKLPIRDAKQFKR